MKQRIAQLFKNHFLLILLILIALYVCYANYTPNTFLTGWDTLHPEFNFRIYWARILASVWQEHQGLGDVNTQAHASEIPRILILMYLSLFLKLNQLRYAYAFLMLILGPTGVYFFLKKIVFIKYTNAASDIGAFAGGLLYLLNLGTLQQFYVPLEMFLTHFGYLGWVFLFSTLYFESGKKKHLLLFIFITFLMAPQAHTSTLFYAYFLIFTVYFSVLFLCNLRSIPLKIAVQRYFFILVGTLIINSFWLLPNLYFVVNHGQEIQAAKITQLFSEEAFLQNKAFGDISDVAILKNFLFNWGENVGNLQYGNLLDVWINHLADPYVLLIGYSFFVAIVIGIIISLLKRDKYGASVFFVFGLCVFFLFNVNPPFGFLFQLLQDKVPLFKEALRFPFTKFSILTTFAYAVFFGYFFANCLQAVSKINKPILNTLVSIMLVSGVSLSLIYFMLPAFNGYMISPSMRVNIPQRYFDMFSYLDHQSDYGRVAELPIHTFWGWIYYDWDHTNKVGYQGAGFLWFGIKQPLMDREFDRWGLRNEQYYREMSAAVYSENISEVEKTLTKYQIRWILFDESVIAPGADQKILFYPQIENILSRSAKIRLEKDFGEGLKLYKFSPDKDFAIQQPYSSYGFGSDNFKENYDPAYVENKPYVVTKGAYPLVGITNNDESLKTNFVSSDSQNIYLNANLASNTTFSEIKPSAEIPYLFQVQTSDNKYSLQFRDVFNLNTLYTKDLPADVKTDEVLDLNNKLIPLRFSNTGSVQINSQRNNVGELFKQTGSGSDSNFSQSTLEACNEVGDNSAYAIEHLPNGIKLSARNTNACVTYALKALLASAKVLPEVISVHVDVADPSTSAVCLFDNQSGLCLNDTNSQNFLVDLRKFTLDNLFIRFISLGNGRESTVSVFSNLSIGYFNKDSDVSFDFPTISKVYLNKPLAIGKDPDLSNNITKFNRLSAVCDGSDDFAGGSITALNNDYVRYNSTSKAVCDSIQFPQLPHDAGYIVQVRSRNVSGIPLRLCITNEYSKRCDVYVSLANSKDFIDQFYVIPTLDSNRGYTLNFSNLTFGGETNVNDLEYLSVTPIPLKYLTSLVSDDFKAAESLPLILYGQSYEKGWIALCGFWFCNAQHVMVDGWANGWVFSTSASVTNVHIVFWPELLQVVGELIVILFVLFALKLPDDTRIL
ncbi:MAG TPA: hypothetical protein VLI92_03925 [Candidatus Saccharimonadales bacterium]|nr:hypothetical protein [Candidatus Saccharimonadales bacterium]